jgi:hypothetical protein
VEIGYFFYSACGFSEKPRELKYPAAYTSAVTKRHSRRVIIVSAVAVSGSQQNG